MQEFIFMGTGETLNRPLLTPFSRQFNEGLPGGSMFPCSRQNFPCVPVFPKSISPFEALGRVWLVTLGRVVQKPISANPGLKVNREFNFFCIKVFLLRVPNRVFQSRNPDQNFPSIP